MGKFAVGTGASVIDPHHRLGMVAVITRLLYGRLLQRKGHSGKDTPQQRRAAFLSFLAGCVRLVRPRPPVPPVVLRCCGAGVRHRTDADRS